LQWQATLHLLSVAAQNEMYILSVQNYRTWP